MRLHGVGKLWSSSFFYVTKGRELFTKEEEEEEREDEFSQARSLPSEEEGTSFFLWP